MATKVRINQLKDAINDYLSDYREDIQDDVIEVTDKVTKEAVQELKATSPVGKRGSYAKGWATKVQKKGKLKYHKVIWNKTDYQLTHLLEFGHAKRNGGYTTPISHIRPVEERYNQEFVDMLQEQIRRQKQ